MITANTGPHIEVLLEVLYVLFLGAKEASGQVGIVKGEFYGLFLRLVFQKSFENLQIDLNLI